MTIDDCGDGKSFFVVQNTSESARGEGVRFLAHSRDARRAPCHVIHHVCTGYSMNKQSHVTHRGSAELAFLDADHFSSLTRRNQQVGLAAQESGNLHDVRHLPARRDDKKNESTVPVYDANNE